MSCKAAFVVCGQGLGSDDDGTTTLCYAFFSSVFLPASEPKWQGMSWSRGRIWDSA